MPNRIIRDSIIAADLIKSTAEAVAIALAKANSETLDLKLSHIQETIARIELNVAAIAGKEEKFLTREEFKEFVDKTVKDLEDKIDTQGIELAKQKNDITKIMTVGGVGMVLIGILEFALAKYF